MNAAERSEPVVYRREDKGLTIVFDAGSVVKRYDKEPTYISAADRDLRFSNELAAYRRFDALRCPFTPELLDFDEAQRWLRIQRIAGTDLLSLTQTREAAVPWRSVIRQLNQMNRWLRKHGFGDMGNNPKDMLLDSDGKLYLIDFEAYDARAGAENADIYNAMISDLLDRIVIRRWRKARLTPEFIRLALHIFIRRPVRATRELVRCLRLRLRS